MGASQGTAYSPRVSPGSTEKGSRAATAPPSRSSPRRRGSDGPQLPASAPATQSAAAAAKRRMAQGPPPTTVKLVSADGSISQEFDVNNVSARAVEEKFRLIRCHVEGDDHSVAFPNKQTGLYERLNGRSVYVVLGHAYNAAEVWKTRPKIDRNVKLIVPKDEIVLEGELQRLHKGIFKKKWVQYYFTLKYPNLEMWEKKGDAKPKAELEINRSIKVSTVDMGTQHPFAFMLNGDEDTWYLSPSSATRREEWMLWLSAFSVFTPPASWKEDEESEDTKQKTLQAWTSFDEAVTAADLEAHGKAEAAGAEHGGGSRGSRGSRSSQRKG